MNETDKETLPLLEAAPFFGVPIPRRRLKHWAEVGVSDRHGGRIKLKTCKIVGRRYVRRADAEAFLAATSEPAPEVKPKPTRQEQAEEAKKRESARQYLRECGMNI